MPLDVPERAAVALPGQRAARAAGALAARGRLRRQPRLQPHDRRGAERDPGAVPLDEPGARPGDDRLPRRAGANPFAGGLLPTGFTGADRGALAAAAAVPAVQQRADQRLRRHQPVRLGAGPKLEKRFSKGYSIIGTYTLVALHRAGVQAERRPTRTSRSGCRATTCRTASTTSILYELPFGNGQAVGRQRQPDWSTRFIGGWSVNAIGQFQSGRPLDFARNVYFNGDLDALKAKYTDNSDVPVFDISGFYFHDAAVQTNGVDDPVKQRADHADPPREATSATSRRASTASAARSSSCGTSRSSSRCRSAAACARSSTSSS